MKTTTENTKHTEDEVEVIGISRLRRFPWRFASRLYSVGAVFSVVLTFCSVARAVEVPPGFVAETVATNLNAATALAVAPDGRVFIADQTGPLRVWKNGRLLPQPALDLTGRLDDYWERGLIGVTLHPDFPHTPHLFVLYVAKQPFTHHVLSRFTLLGARADPASELVLLEGDDQSKLGGTVPHGHQGGPVRFGPDGRLYLGLGEQTAGEPAQRLDSLLGKILHLNSDGTIPTDNPFVSETTGKYRAIWARGIRNTFGLAFEPGTGRLFETDVGQTSWEEVNIIEPGANYGWPQAEGPSENPAFRNPIHAYPPVVGRSIVGAAFAPASFEKPWAGKFFFADWAANWIKALDPAAPTNVTTFAKGLSGPVALEFAPDGSLFVLNRNTIWRDGKKWQADSGSLVRIRFTGGVGEASAPARPPLPRSLSASGLFASLNPARPREGFEPFTVQHEPWQPGVITRRWISLPPGGALRITAEGEFEFPEGTIVIQQHAGQKAGAPFETQVLWFTGPRVVRAAAYRWNEDRTDAQLIEDGEVIALPGDPTRRWFSPGTEETLTLDNVVTGFVLPLSPRQLPRDELARWNKLGRFTPALTEAQIASRPRLAALDAPDAPLDQRVRSYLDANCASCHRPGGPSRGNFDARFLTPLDAQSLLNGALLAGDLGIPGARVIVPGHPEKSVMLQRLTRDDFVRMPPVNVNHEPQPVAPLLEAWIRSLAPPATK